MSTPNDAELDRHLDAAVESLNRLQLSVDIADSRDGLTLVGRIKESFNGWPQGKAFDTERGGGRHEEVTMPLRTNPGRQVEHTVPIPRNDPTGEAAIRPDRARDDLKQLHRLAKAAANTAAAMLDIAARYNLREANQLERQIVEEEPGCVSCARVTSPGTLGWPKDQQTRWWNAISKVTTLTSGASVALCRFCYDSPVVGSRFTGELPQREDVESYRDHGRARKRSA